MTAQLTQLFNQCTWNLMDISAGTNTQPITESKKESSPMQTSCQPEPVRDISNRLIARLGGMHTVTQTNRLPSLEHSRALPRLKAARTTPRPPLPLCA